MLTALKIAHLCQDTSCQLWALFLLALVHNSKFACRALKIARRALLITNRQAAQGLSQVRAVLWGRHRMLDLMKLETALSNKIFMVALVQEQLLRARWVGPLLPDRTELRIALG
jgi:hypothetical protein